MSAGTEGCHVERVEPRHPRKAPDRTETALLGVAGMGCVNCANRVHNGLVRVPGVLHVKVELAIGVVRIEYDPDRTELATMLAAVGEAGRSSGHRYRAAPLSARVVN